MYKTTIAGFLLMTAGISAQEAVNSGHDQRFIQHDNKAGLTIVEAVTPGMTLYSLARKYHVSIDMLLAQNPELQPDAVPLGFPVKIPLNPEKISFDPSTEAGEKIMLSYEVQPKETLYRISKTYLNVSPDVISSLNPGSINGLSVGQVLHVGWMLPTVDDLARENKVDSVFTVKEFSDAVKTGTVIRHQKGLAVWKPGKLSSHFYVLHPSAVLGSLMEITNPMNHRTITAKVAGHIPPGLYPANVGIVVSPSTARALGVLDQQFFARWRFVE